ncbi:MAG: hypothetical protein U1E65_32915 [Myxococcota bacterium]
MMRSFFRRGLWLPLIAALSGCPTNQTPLTGQFDRPSGMGLVVYGASAADPSASRADVFVADSEAGGVRVVQMIRRVLAPVGTATVPSYYDPNSFVRAPALYFPLIVPTGSFPTAITISSDHHRGFVLSPADGVVFVFSTDETLYDHSITASPGYGAIGRIDLAAIVGVSGQAVDIEALPGVGGAQDTLLVALDPIGSQNGQVVALSLSAALEPHVVASATVAAAPRRLTVRTATPAAIFTTSAVGPSFSMLPLTGDAAVFGPAQSLDAGGPTSDIVDGDSAGVVALRLDAALAIVFDAAGGLLEKSTRRIRSPGIVDAARPGEITLPTAGIIGRTQRLGLLPSGVVDGRLNVALPDLEGDGKTPVMLIVHQNGGTSFLLGHPLRAATGRDSSITRLEDTGREPVSVAGCSVASSLTNCEFRVLHPSELAAPNCAASLSADPDGEAGTFRATYQGALAKEEGGTIEPVGSATTTTYRLVPRAADGNANGQAKIGDLVMFQLSAPSDRCGGLNLVSSVCTGTVTAFAAKAVVVTLRANEQSCKLRPLCTSFPLARWEMFPAGRELVLSELSNGALIARGRAPLTATTATGTPPGRAWRAHLPAVLDTTISSSVAPVCVLETLSTPVDCTSDTDCGGRMCAAAASSLCLGACITSCAGEPGCNEAPVQRRCSGVEMTRIDATWVGQASGVSSSFEASIPDDIVVSPIRSSWLISFPGARSVIEIKVNDLTEAFELSALR